MCFPKFPEYSRNPDKRISAFADLFFIISELRADHGTFFLLRNAADVPIEGGRKEKKIRTEFSGGGTPSHF